MAKKSGNTYFKILLKNSDFEIFKLDKKGDEYKEIK